MGEDPDNWYCGPCGCRENHPDGAAAVLGRSRGGKREALIKEQPGLIFYQWSGREESLCAHLRLFWNIRAFR